VVIVGLNAREYVRQSLRSLAQAGWRGRRHEVVYVDNGSSDGTPAMVAEEFPEALLFVNPTNFGYCKAANQGARRSRGRYLYFLNDDTVVLDDAIAILVDYLDERPETGTVGSRLVYPDGTEQFSGRRFPTFINGVLGRRSLLSRIFPDSRWVRAYLCRQGLESGQPFDVDWVSAAGQIVRREVFEQVGGYAEDYYYWHEAVFCDRIRAAGWKVQLHPGSRIIHYEGKGSGPRPFRTQRFHIVNFHRGAFRCYCEHHRLGPLHPRRWLAGAALTLRAMVLLATSGLRSGGLAVARQARRQA
jgi:GT2 family glycosyltransferase